MNDDPFSDILKPTDAETVVSGGFTAGGAWAIRFPAPDKLKFFALIKGSCWLRIAQDEPVRVEQGDVFLLTVIPYFVLASDLEVAPLDAQSLFAGKTSKLAKLGTSDDCVQIGGHVRRSRPETLPRFKKRQRRSRI